MTSDSYIAARRWIFGGLVAFVVWELAGSLLGFGMMLNYQHHQQQEALRDLQQSADRQAKLIRENANRAGRGPTQPNVAPAAAAARPLSTSSQSKLTPTALVSRLRKLNAFDLAANPRHVLYCASGGGAWDYVCVVERQAGKPSSRAQFGALVDSERIVELSKLYPLGARLPAPVNLRSN